MGVCALTLAGCSNAKKDAQSAIDASNKIKSGQTYVTSTSQTSAATGATTSVSEGTFTSNPFRAEMNQINQNQSKNQYYVDNGVLYTSMKNKWYKAKLGNSSNFIKNAKATLTGTSNTFLLKELKNNFKESTSGNNIVLSYSGTDSTASNFAKKYFLYLSNNKNASTVNKASFKSLKFTYKMNKKTYLPVSCSISVKYASSAKAAVNTSNVDSTYGSINKVNSVAIPQGIISSAKPLPKQVQSLLLAQ